MFDMINKLKNVILSAKNNQNYKDQTQHSKISIFNMYYRAVCIDYFCCASR